MRNMRRPSRRLRVPLSSDLTPLLWGSLLTVNQPLSELPLPARPQPWRRPVPRRVYYLPSTPVGHLTDSHFYASTAAWLLQLLAIVPSHVPLLVSSNVRLRSLCATAIVVFL